MPPVSRFGGGNRATKKKTVIDRLKATLKNFMALVERLGLLKVCDMDLERIML